MSLPRLRLSKKTAPQSVNEKQSSLVRYQQYFINELSLLRNFCHKCQKPLFYTLCLLRHRSLPYHCTVCFAIPRLRPFSFVCQRVEFIDTLRRGKNEFTSPFITYKIDIKTLILYKINTPLLLNYLSFFDIII